MRIKQLLIGMTASVIAVSSYVEMAIADLNFLCWFTEQELMHLMVFQTLMVL